MTQNCMRIQSSSDSRSPPLSQSLSPRLNSMHVLFSPSYINFNNLAMKHKPSSLAKIRQQEYVANPTVWVNKSLFRRYCQSQNYYYTRDINEILADSNTKAVVRFKDCQCLDDDDEYLKRYYLLEEYPQKIALLTEYYKFHTDITRIFMEPIGTILNKYYDKKRKFEYYRIARLIEEENKKNPNRPPKGIVGERPSPVNSHDSDPEEPEEQIPVGAKHVELLRDLSFLNKTNHSKFHMKQDFQKVQPNKRSKMDVSQTLNEICKNLGTAAVQPDQSSLCLGQIGKAEELKLDRFLQYMTQQQKKFELKSKPKSQISGTPQPQTQKLQKKFSHPQEILIQQIITQQLSQQKLEEYKARLGSQHNSKEKQLHLKTQGQQQQLHYNFMRSIAENTSCQKSSKQGSSEAQGSTRLEQKTIEVPPQGQKAKTITGHQPKISQHLFLKDFKQSIQNGSQLVKAGQPQKTQSNAQMGPVIPTQQLAKLNLKQIAKLFIDEDATDQELKWKTGSQTHRPMSGTGNFFNSNRNSPGLGQPFRSPLYQDAKPILSKAKAGAAQNKPKGGQNQLFRKQTQPNIHIRQTSGQDRIININININDHPEYLKQRASQSKHKKHCSDGKGILLRDQGIYNDSQQDVGCLTDRGTSSEYLFKNNLTSQSSPKGQVKRVNSGLKIYPQSVHSTTNRGALIQQMINQVSRKHGQGLQRFG